MLPSTRTARLEIPLGDGARRLVEAVDGARDLAGDQRPRAEAEQQHDATQQRQVEQRGPDRAVHGVDALGDANSTDRPAVVDDRDGGGEQILPQRVAVAGDLQRLATQRRGDLRTVGVTRSHLGRAGAVGEQAPAPIDRYHSPPHRPGGDRGQAIEAPPVRRAQQLGRRGGDHVRLAARLAPHLGVDAVAQADGERHPKGDQRQQEDVRQCQQQDCAECYGPPSVGALKRKPTPRSVSI